MTALLGIALFAGMAIGVMLMAVLQRHAPRLKARLEVVPGKRPPEAVAQKVVPFRAMRDRGGHR